MTKKKVILDEQTLFYMKEHDLKNEFNNKITINKDYFLLYDGAYLPHKKEIN